ncbi:translocation/assembly module TamB domain-containing protein [Xanthobacter sediminis]|uniref:translocation/assembly module TamB domain-containing protein n=1 Tax=Xanthobacter sediminis TaxID=3119926 RepID=UPI003726AA17
MAARGISSLLLRGAGYALAAVAVILIALFGGLQTGPGKTLLARVASSLASVSGLTVSITDIRGGVPWDMSIGRVAVADGKGPVAEVEALRLSWHPLSLLSGVVNVEALEARRIAVERLPELPPTQSAPAKSTPTKPASGGSSFMMPVRLGRLAVEDISLGAPVLGHAAQLSLTASADLMAAGKGLAADFAVERRDAPGTVKGRVHYTPDNRILDVDIAASEPAGGLVARAAGMEGLPPLDARVSGKGPIDAWDGRLSLSAGDVAQVTGAAGVRAVGSGHRVNVALDADVSKLLPPAVAPLLEERTEISATALVEAAGPVEVETLTVRATGFGVAAKGRVDAEGASTDLAFSAVAGDADRFQKLAPGVGWKSVKLEGGLKGLLATPALSARLDAAGLSGAGYGAGALAAEVKTAPDSGALNIALDATASGLTAADAKVRGALGDTARITATAVKPAAGDVALTGFTAQLAALSARFSGTASADAARGTFRLERLDLAAFGPLAGRPLAGTARLEADVTGADGYDRLTLKLAGGTENIRTGIAAVDGLFGATSRLVGTLARAGADAFTVEGLTLAATGLDLKVDGTLSRRLADLKANLILDDLKRVEPRLTGRLDGSAAFSGSLDALAVTARLAVPEGAAMGQKIEGLALGLEARDLTALPSGRFTLDGRIAGKPATGGGAFALGDQGAARLDGLDLAIGSVTARGDLARGADGLLAGQLAVAAGNLADLSALALTELAGRLDAKVELGTAAGRQTVAVNATADNVRAAGQSVGAARVNLNVADPAGQPVLDGTVSLTNVEAGVSIPRASLQARRAGQGSALTLDAQVNGANVAAAAQVAYQDAISRVRLDRLSVARGGTTLATSAPANITIADGAVAIDRLALASRGGVLTVSGRAGSSLDLNVDVHALPLAVAELAAPGLGLAGTVSGTARVRGSADRPEGPYDIQVSRLSTPDLAKAGAGPFDIRTAGALGGGRVTTRTTITGNHLSNFAITGSAPLGAGDLDLAVRGGVDLRIANASLAAMGSQLTGNAAIDATVRGTAAAPRAGGTVRISGARYNDGANGITLDRIEGVIAGTERSVTVNSLTARTPNGGSISARGSVGLDPAANFPGRIEVTMQNAGLVNSEMIRLVTEGRIAVEGQFTNDPHLTGRVDIRAMDVNIAEHRAGGVQALNVRHVNDARGRDAARATPPAPKRERGGGGSGGITLDLTVAARNNIFVRGMGMEAELGGELRVSGTSRAPVTQGGFDMRRGRFDILGKRLNFTRGKITFTGSTDPDLDFIAETTANDITARILVTGPASQPEITFTSEPTLPQDEVLARLLFGRNAGSLTAAQSLQIAQTIAQFSGGGGVLEQMRRSLGVDSLDVGTNAAGTGGQVGLGRRINDRIYMGVRQGTTPNSSQVTVDVDVTKNIRLQGATGADGNTSVGIGAQWDY